MYFTPEGDLMMVVKLVDFDETVNMTADELRDGSKEGSLKKSAGPKKIAP